MIAELGYNLEPFTVISALAGNNITTVESVLGAFHFILQSHYAEFVFLVNCPINC